MLLVDNLDGVGMFGLSRVYYIGYRRYEPILYRGLYTTGLDQVVASTKHYSVIEDDWVPEDREVHSALALLYRQGLIKTGRVWSGADTGKLMDRLRNGESIDGQLHMDNHDGILFYLNSKWYFLMSSDWNYYLWEFKGLDIIGAARDLGIKQAVIKDMEW